MAGDPSPASDSDVAGPSEGVNYLKNYFGKSSTAFHAPWNHGRAPEKQSATIGACVGSEYDHSRLEIGAELASILFPSDADSLRTELVNNTRSGTNLGGGSGGDDDCSGTATSTADANQNKLNNDITSSSHQHLPPTSIASFPVLSTDYSLSTQLNHSPLQYLQNNHLSEHEQPSYNQNCGSLRASETPYDFSQNFHLSSLQRHQSEDKGRCSSDLNLPHSSFQISPLTSSSSTLNFQAQEGKDQGIGALSTAFDHHSNSQSQSNAILNSFISRLDNYTDSNHRAALKCSSGFAQSDLFQHSMENPSHGAELSPNPIDLAQIWSSLAKASRSSGIIGNEISLENRPFSILDEEEKKRIEIEFSHLVVEEECAPSSHPSPPLSNSSSIHDVTFALSGPSSATTSHSSLSEELYSSSKETCHGDLSSYIFTGNSLLPTDRCPTSVYSTNQSIQSLNDFSNLNDTFKSFINSFEMSSSSQFSVAQPTAPPEAASTLAASNSFLSSTCLGVNSTPEVDQTFQFPIELTSSSVSESLSSHPIDVSIGSISSVPSPASMIHPNAQESIKADFNESTHRDAETKGSPPPSVASNHRCSNMGTNSVSPSVPFGKSNSCATSLTLDVATEVELAIPQLIKLDRLNTYPTEDIKLFLIGLPAEGAKTRVETQIKLTIALVVGQGGSVDREGNLVTDVARSNLARIGNWSYIKLPVYSAIKWKSKKLIKTGIPPEETLYLDVAVMRASEPYDEIYCCSNCQLREQKRTQRKRDARVRPAQEIDSDEADQVVLPEDEKRKIVVFNCGQYVDFHTGEITLPTRITCYCRHHREKKGFRVKVSLRDHKNVLVASSVTPAIMITDDHKAVAAAAKAKSTSDVEDANLKTRPIRKLPAMNTTANQSTSTKLRKKKSSIMSVPSSMALGDLSYDESSGQICSKISINCGLSDKSVESQSPVSSNQQSLTPSIAKSKRKALGEHGLRVSSGKKSASNQASFKLEENALSALPSTTKKACQISVINDYPNSGEFQGSILSLPQHKDPAASENSQILTVTCDSGPIAPITITTPSSLKPGATSRKKRPKDKTTNSLKSSPRRRQADSKTRLKIKPALTIDVDMKDIRLNKRVGDCFLPAQNEQSFQKPISPHNSDYFLVDPIIYQKAIDSSVAEKKTSENFCLKNYEQTDQTQELHQSLSGAELTSSSASSPDRITPNPLVSQNCSSPSTSPNRATDSRRSSRPDNSYSACNSRNISQNQVLGDLFRDSSSEDINHTLDISNWPSAPTEKSTEATAPSHACNTSSQLTGQSPMGIMGNVLANWDVLSSFLPSAQSSSCDSSSTTPLRTKEVKSITLSRSNVNNLLIENKGRIETVSKTSARIQKLVPNEGPMEGGVEITILGEGFHPNLKAVFSCGSVVKTEFWSSKALVCILPPSVVSGRCEVSLTSEGEGDYMTQEGQVFTYLNKADQKLMELALQVVGLKMTGQIQDVKIFARKLIKRK